MPATETTVPIKKAKTLYKWTSLDHGLECPRNQKFNEKRLIEMVREKLGLGPKDQMPERST